MNHRRYIACSVRRNGCSGDNLSPTGPEGRNRGTFTFVMTNEKRFSLYWVVPFNKTGYICNGPAPGGAGVAMNHRRYIAYTMYWVIPFNPTG